MQQTPTTPSTGHPSPMTFSQTPTPRAGYSQSVAKRPRGSGAPLKWIRIPKPVPPPRPLLLTARGKRHAWTAATLSPVGLELLTRGVIVKDPDSPHKPGTLYRVSSAQRLFRQAPRRGGA